MFLPQNEVSKEAFVTDEPKAIKEAKALHIIKNDIDIKDEPTLQVPVDTKIIEKNIYQAPVIIEKKDICQLDLMLSKDRAELMSDTNFNNSFKKVAIPLLNQHHMTLVFTVPCDDPPDMSDFSDEITAGNIGLTNQTVCLT